MALLVQVATRIEEGDPVARLVARYDIVYRSQKPVVSSNVGQHLDVQFGLELKVPIPPTGATRSAQPFVRVASFQIAAVEVRGLTCPQPQAGRLVTLAIIVNGDHPHLTRVRGTVDQPQKARP